jgi:glucosamine-6-phosphate deaminase
MLAAAPSQEATLKALSAETDVDWSRVECFHMDEYVGLNANAPQGFGNWLQAHFLDHIPQAVFHRITPSDQPEQERARYSHVMGSAPFDVVLLGLGVNGHLAFNDPPADFADPQLARVVTLDRISRQQQVDEGHFATLDQVPTRAITVTIPRLLNSVEIIASVPGRSKRQAVAETLSQPVQANYPGTALRTHPRVYLLLDAESDPGRAHRTA